MARTTLLKNDTLVVVMIMAMVVMMMMVMVASAWVKGSSGNFPCCCQSYCHQQRPFEH